jgi:hypothetical protein
VKIDQDLQELCARLDGIRVDAQTASLYAHKDNPRLISLMFAGLEKRISEVQSLALKIRDGEV